MPTLSQRKDGGHYFRAYVWGAGIVTYQVSVQGLAYLQKLRIKVGDEIDNRLVRILADRGLIKTGGSGVNSQTQITAQIQKERIIRSLQIRFVTDEDAWRLELIFPALPKSWVARLGADAPNRLSGCGFSVDQNQHINAARLWPGRGDATCVVVPHSTPYQVQPTGSWPKEWDLKGWLQGADGLDPKGVFFATGSNESVRLGANDSLEPGEVYSFVVLDTAENNASTKGPLPIPAMLSPRLLPSSGKWRAWEITIPSTDSDRVRDWCELRGHPIGALSWHLDLVAPFPEGYSDSGLPIFPLGTEVTVAAYPPVSAGKDTRAPTLVLDLDGLPLAEFQLQAEAPATEAYFSWTATKEGLYRLRAMKGSVTPVTLAVESTVASTPISDIASVPMPLEVAIGDYRQRAFAKPRMINEVFLSAIGQDELPKVTVSCPVPINLFLTRGNVRTKFQQLQSQEAEEAIAVELTAGLESGDPFGLSIATDSYGALEFLISRTAPSADSSAQWDTNHEPGPSNSKVAIRARWLNIAIPALLDSRESGTTSLPRDMRAKLARFGKLKEIASLAEFETVPTILLPHLRALVQSISG